MLKNLAVFDFDHTVINDNSDIAVMNLVNRTQIPKEVKDLHKSDGWTAFMQAIFEILHANNVTETSIRDLMCNLPEVPGMSQLIKILKEDLNYDVIIISDSNSYFIQTWLDSNNLTDYVLKVFTNPAHFDGELLKIEMYHLQDSCKLSTKNLCKGQIMEEFVETQCKAGVEYQRVIYCGDGTNDFCPILRLKDTDVACVRKNYKCEELVEKSTNGEYVDPDGVSRGVQSEVCLWKDGFDIITFIKC